MTLEPCESYNLHINTDGPDFLGGTRMILRCSAILAACVLFVGSASASDILMGRADPHQTSYTPEQIQLPVALKWEYTGNKSENNPAAPIVFGKTCFFACGEFVYAVDLDTGAFKWKYPSERGLGGSIKSTPAYYNGSLYFGASDGNLYCLDAVTGTFKWAFPVRGSIRCSPIISDGIIYFGADDDSIYAISADTGDSLWARPFTARDDIAIGIAVSNGVVTAASMDGNVYVVTPTGRLKTVPFRIPQAPTNTSPVIVENVAVMAVGNSMLGLTTRSNQLRWQVTLPAEAAATPAVSGNDVFVPCRDKKVYAYNVGGRTPVLKWTQPAEIGGMPMSSPTVAGDTLYVTASKGIIAAFSTETGTAKWRYQCSPSPITLLGRGTVDAASSPTIANGSVLVLTDDGVLHCFTADAPDMEAPKPYDMVPANAALLSSAPPIKMSCKLYDLGSGVDFTKASLSLDDQPVDGLKIDPASLSISYIYDTKETGKAVQKLTHGPHNITVTAEDYKGNLLSQSWVFFADDSLPPPKRATPAETKPTRTTTPPPSRAPSRPTFTPNVPGGMPPPPPPPPAPAPAAPTEK